MDTIVELACEVFCLQEIEKESFDLLFIRKFSPRQFDNFEYLSSTGASEGLLVAQKSSIFRGLLFSNEFPITLTNIYSPCTHEGKRYFLN